MAGGGGNQCGDGRQPSGGEWRPQVEGIGKSAKEAGTGRSGRVEGDDRHCPTPFRWPSNGWSHPLPLAWKWQVAKQVAGGRTPLHWPENDGWPNLSPGRALPT